MSYALAPHISWCETAGRLVFLDVARDRYLCLTSDGERAFRRMRDAAALTDGDCAVLDRLIGRGLLCPSDQPAGGSLPVPRAAARASLLDAADRDGRAPALEIVAMAWQVVLAESNLRLGGLRHALAGVVARKGRGARPDRAPALASLQAMRALGTVLSAHDRCLPRSIALARRLLANGHRPDLVIGVRLQPFKAHCWVELGQLIVNERVDVVRAFAPILVV